MKFSDFIPIIVAIISLISSYIIAKVTAKKEINKITIEYQHQNNVRVSLAYAKLRENLNIYIVQNNGLQFKKVLSSLGNFFSCCPNTMIPICKELENNLINNHKITNEFLEQLDIQWNLSQTSNKVYKS